MSTTTIRDILGSRRLHSVKPNETLGKAALAMAENRVGAVVVLDGDSLVGIISERDIVFRCVARSLSAEDTKVADVMTREPVTVDVDDAISDALAIKLGDTFRHLPVMEAGRVVGMLSYRDIPPEYLMMFERFREMSSARADGGV